MGDVAAAPVLRHRMRWTPSIRTAWCASDRRSGAALAQRAPRGRCRHVGRLHPARCGATCPSPPQVRTSRPLAPGLWVKGTYRWRWLSICRGRRIASQHPGGHARPGAEIGIRWEHGPRARCRTGSWCSPRAKPHSAPARATDRRTGAWLKDASRTRPLGLST